MEIKNIDYFIKENKIEKIFLDVDGVIFHSCQAICDIINEWYGTDYNGSEIMSWNFKELGINFTDEEVEELFETEAFFDYVCFIKGVKSFIHKYEDKIIVVTKANPNNFIQKKLLFDLNCLNVPIVPIPLNVSKRIIDMSDGLFVDDSAKNLKESNAKFKIQFREYKDNLSEKREWIKNWDGYVMYNWQSE